MTVTFKFRDDVLNRRLLCLLKKSRVSHRVDHDGLIHYSTEDEEKVENNFISSIRDEVFPTWQVIACPSDWIERYEAYMKQRNVPFKQEVSNNEVWFLVPGNYRPHSWRI